MPIKDFIHVALPDAFHTPTSKSLTQK